MNQALNLINLVIMYFMSLFSVFVHVFSIQYIKYLGEYFCLYLMFHTLQAAMLFVSMKYM